jgi:hypothetical protein
VGKKTIAALDSEMLAKEKGGGGRRGFVGPVSKNVTHTLIYFSGASKNGGLDGVELTGGNREDVQIEMEGIDVNPQLKVVKGFGGSNKTQAGVFQASLVVATRNPLGKLIIYGFSAGGINSLQLCRFLEPLGANVDLLVTVDVSDGTTDSPSVDPLVPSNVLLNRNYFQKTKITFGPHGLKTQGGQVVPIDCTNRRFSIATGKTNHGQMETITHFETIGDMRKALAGP